MNKSTYLDSKVFWIMDLVFSLAKTSVFFWVALIKEFFIFGLVASFCTLVEMMDEVLLGNGGSIREGLRERSQKYKGYKKISLFTFCFFIYTGLFIIFPLPESVPADIGVFTKFAFVYLYLLGVVLFTYVSWNLVKLNLSVKKALFYGFYLMFKRFVRSILLFAVFLVIVLLSQMNLIFLIFIAPSLYVMCGTMILRKIYKSEVLN
ncbi:hypothetical protein ABER70_06495 [Bacillus subtilis]|uniref:hypothetical protein n=1 Tax=Bacillus sp. FSL M8-0071 TaxID=2921567 RepID=UPI0030DBAA4B